MNITEFLLARIVEDEAVACAAIEDDRGETGGMEDSFDCLTGREQWFGEDVLPRYGDAIARLIVHTAVPARVLAECEAKRQLVEAYVDMDALPEDERADQRVTLRWACEVLAAVYADHPDYDEAWRP